MDTTTFCQISADYWVPATKKSILSSICFSSCGLTEHSLIVGLENKLKETIPQQLNYLKKHVFEKVAAVRNCTWVCTLSSNARLRAY